MKKSLIALAALGAFAGAASAQSSVTIYGFIDQSLTKPYTTEDKMVADGAFYGGGSRLGFRGVEDLGGGYKAVFGMEHRLSADTGAQTAGTFWQGYSTVGLVTPFGAVNLGRQYTPAFVMIQNQIDPFGGETVAQGREVGMRFGVVNVCPAGTAVGSTCSQIYKTRVADSVRYDLSVAGFNLGVSIAESASNNAGVSDDKPFSIAANYAAGPFWVGIGYENPAAEEDKGWNIGGRYNFGFMTAALGYSKGTTAAGLDAKGWLIGATVPYGAFDFKAVYATNDIDVIGETKKAGVGVHYNFSKRTKIYADVAKIGGSATIPFEHKTGYDLGLKHTF